MSSDRRQRLSRLLRPQSIAVIGGGTWCSNVVHSCATVGFSGPIWPVHPSKGEIAGKRAYASIADLPQPPDACFIGVNREATIAALEELNRIGAGGAVCFASGFAEASAELEDGADLQHSLLTAAGDMVVLGPNCYGMLNFLDGAALWPDQHGGTRVESGVAIITQSSNIAINLTMQQRGLPIAYVVTAGNQAQTDAAEVAMELLRDPRVTCLGLHLEGIRNIKALEDLSKVSHELGKPICVLKVGQSEQAQIATLSHTASLAGSTAGSEALLRRLGFAQIPDLDAFLEVLKIWHVAGPLKGKGIASASCSGGEASLMADLGKSAGVQFPALTEKQTSALRAALGPRVALANPLDYHTYIWGDLEKMEACYRSLAQADLDLCAIVLDLPRADRCSVEDWAAALDAVIETARKQSTPIALISSLPETLPEALAQRMITAGVIPLNGMKTALQAIAFSRYISPNPDPILPPLAPLSARTLSEAEAKTRLSQFGLRVPHSALANSPDEAAEAARHIKGLLVLKGSGHAHKTEAGAVALNLSSPDAVRKAAVKMNTASYLVEEMVENTIQELLIGVVLDPAHGYVLTLGAGGTQTELLNDRCTFLLPVSREDVEAGLDALRCGPVLRGYRGAPGVSQEALWQAISAVQAYVLAHHGAVQEIEINPLICTAKTAIAADALIVEGEKSDAKPD